MENLTAWTVFFVKDAESSLRFYTETLGFALDWNHQEQGRAFVFRVSLFGFELMLNQIEPWTKDRAGHGRAFIGLNDDQTGEFVRYIEHKGIKTTAIHWGAPTLVIHDLDQNELFIWLPEQYRAQVEAQIVTA